MNKIENRYVKNLCNYENIRLWDKRPIGEYTAEWEDGDNSSAYVTCKHCGCYNFK